MISQLEHPQTPFNLTLGISIGLLASFIQSLGLTIQRKSHLQNHSLPPSSRKPDYARPVWLIGFTIYFTFNILGSIFQIGTLPLIILGPLGAISLLWNAILARLLLADRFSIHLIFGTLLIGLGALLIGLYGLLPDQSTSHDLDQLIYLYSRTPFLIEIAFLILSLSAICSFAHLYEFRLNQSLETISLLTISPSPTPPPPHHHHHSSPATISTKHSPSRKKQHHHYPAYRPPSTTSPTTHRPQTDSSQPISLSFPHHPIAIIDSHIPLTPPFTRQHHPPQRSIHHPTFSTLNRTNSSGAVQLPSDKVEGMDGQGMLSTQKIDKMKLLIGIAYGSTSGTLSGICLLFAKTGVELLIRSITGSVNEFCKFQTWLILLVLLISALLQLWYLNKALRLVNPTLICPLAFCFYNLSSIISSLVYYDQVKLLSAFQVFAISLGTIILLGGVWVVSIGTSSNTSSSSSCTKNSSEPVVEGHSDRGSAVDEDEVTPLLSSSSRIGENQEELEEEEEDSAAAAAGMYTEEPVKMDGSSHSEPPNHRPSLSNTHLQPPESSGSSHPLSKRSSHPFDQLIRQFLVEGEVSPVRGFSIGLGAASPGFAIRPNNRGMNFPADAALARSSLTWSASDHADPRHSRHRSHSQQRDQQL
ncbi:hypothetical protein VP01_452g3 [Puccinia sorghi]|uniref:Uncharacterized protein n=1 Tax=Puccinia sorghi TaxID=27349 RepID=A0A0L6UNZ2_9BASI|nr:hypothetical protein VP01_452g3 [Puccinia sorghi]